MKKLQGRCYVCNTDIANLPPYHLTGIHGNHGQVGRASKEFQPSRLRNCANSWDDMYKELNILEGFCCAGCHARISDDFGSKGHKK